MIRLARVSAAVLALLLATGSARAESLPPQLRSNVSLSGDTLHLGDLWENLGNKAQTVVAAAPQPGKHITVEARWLAAVAAANGIDWHPSGPFDRVVIERTGEAVAPALVETELKEALAMEGLPANSGLDIANKDSLKLMVPSGEEATVAVHEVSYDPRTQRFSAVLEAPAGSPAAVRVRVAGRTYTNTKVPVLARTIARGDTISERDIEWKEMREESVRQDTAIEVRQLVGMEPRYQIHAGVPVVLGELQRPVMVARSADVTIVLRTPFMTLTAQGRALDDGGRGDIIKVTNLQTKQIVDGRIEGPGMVSVTPASARIVSN